jgi:hypothetical protein
MSFCCDVLPIHLHRGDDSTPSPKSDTRKHGKLFVEKVLRARDFVREKACITLERPKTKGLLVMKKSEKKLGCDQAWARVGDVTDDLWR